MATSWFRIFRFIKVFTILSTALLISACNTEEFANEVADSVLVSNSESLDTSRTTNSDSNIQSVSNNNQPAIISGKSVGEVTEDLDGNKDGFIAASGDLGISDDDPGEESFIATSKNSNYGNIEIDDSGYWFWILNNDLSVVQDLNDGESLTDSVTVSSVDGTTHTIVITILGADEPVATGPGDDGVTDPTDTTNNGSEPDPQNPAEPIETLADINLSWTAPSAREDDSAISLSEIAGYKIYYGTTEGNYTNNVFVDGGQTDNITINNFTEGTYYFVITTSDTDGYESQYSSVVTITI